MNADTKYIERKIRRLYREQGQAQALTFLDEIMQDYRLMRIPPDQTHMLRLKMLKKMIQYDTLMAYEPT